MRLKKFTKSAFKIALECPRRLYYAYDSNLYANQNLADEFLQTLANGGFQVGELAKVYYDIKGDADIDVLDYDEAVEKTKELFKNENINIAEAAFMSGDLFVRADIIEKRGNDITLIEVKAKSWYPSDSFLAPKNVVKSDLRPYLYDVAFQKYVIMKALAELYPGQTFNVKARLMMVDKSKVATVDGLNQMFRIYKKNDRSYAVADERAWTVAGTVPMNERILTAFNVDDICNMIIEGSSGEQGKDDNMQGMKFKPFVELMSKHYCERTKAKTSLGRECFKCPFFKGKDDHSKLLDGYKECWKEMAGFKDEDFDKPLTKDLSGSNIGVKKNKLIKERKYFLSDLTYDDLDRSKGETGKGLDYLKRKWLHIAVATDNKEIQKDFGSFLNDGIYLDTDGLKEEMDKWTYPLHFIDFETSATALPFYKGRRPYEQIAFQFSHHKVDMNADGSYKVSHAHQYINTEKGFFPNFEFARELKAALEGDQGTIFRYSNHENTILRAIHKQLDDSDEPDKDELMAFIDSITDKAERTMIDLADLVLKYYFHPIMKGIYSIKVVLPAVLNSSEFIKNRYSEPIYGTDKMPSLNLKDKVWVKYSEDRKEVLNPYKLLPSVASYIDVAEEVIDAMELDEVETVANGGAALAAYAKIQFSDTQMCEALKQALLCYCELDTLAMVFIWEYFYDCCRKA